MAGKKCYIKDYGTIMLHNPSGGGDKDVLDLVKKTLVTIFTNRTSKTAEEIDAMMSKETWLSATEALNHGIVDEVITSNKKIRVPKDNIYNVALIYNKLINEEKNMINITNKLGLNEGASEDLIVKAIENKEKQITDLQTELNAIKADQAKKEKEANEKALTELTAKATALAENAVKEGKIKEEEKAQTISDAVSNYALVENLLSKINAKKEPVKIFDPKSVTNSAGVTEDRSTWSFDDWCKNDSAGLLKIQNEHPEIFKTLVDKLPKSLSPNFIERD